MAKVLEKVERRLGERLFIKGDRCVGPKCAVVRRGTPPGVHGGKIRGGRRGRSEYGALLSEKQKIRYLYGLDDRDIERYSKEAASLSGIYANNLIMLLETRLDNVVFRLGFADSKRMARFLVSHRHIMVNDHRVNIPSFRIKKGNTISITPRSEKKPFFGGLGEKLSKVQLPKWLGLDAGEKRGTIIEIPKLEDVTFTADIAKVKEFYSR